LLLLLLKLLLLLQAVFGWTISELMAGAEQFVFSFVVIFVVVVVIVVVIADCGREGHLQLMAGKE
jgi:hypothetical protein